METKQVVKSIVSLFKLYPEIFASGYMRFVFGSVKKEIERNTAMYDVEAGYYFSWWRGKRNPKKWRIEKIVVTRNNQGQGTELMEKFLTMVGKNYESVELKVLKTNKIAIKWYKKYGFLVVQDKGDYWKMLKTKKVNKAAIQFRKSRKI